MIKKDTWYVLGNGLQTRFRGRGKAGWESKDLPLPFPIEYTNEGTCNLGESFTVSHERNESDLLAMIGYKVAKVSGDGKRAAKPFKSGNKENTVKGVLVSQFTGNTSFTFHEDDSVVDCDICCITVNDKSIVGN